MSKPLKFKISSGLKDIIGRDLITDDFMAVFELVKNSYDAHASIVDITFYDVQTGNGRIVIKDNGKGMTYNDLVNKWLFVAYSAKKEGTEDDDQDYREKIFTKRPFAGAKGIGRFSCDRLGKLLYLETTSQEMNSHTEVLITDWEKFEIDSKEDFINISVLHETKEQSDFGIKHGLVLEIKNLRNEWDRQKLIKLKDSLAKLINPSSNKGHNKFTIYLNAANELEKDLEEKDERYRVNGQVKNFIFEDLGLKTTKIFTSISEDGKTSLTELRDGNTLIYEIQEKNKYFLLKNINFTLYYLNQSAKLTFARRMGLASRLYGHVFLYKNGIRIYPFGEPGVDPLNINERKSRKQFSFLGTSELMGQIEIFGDNPELKETSSRGDGLIKSPTYFQLKDAFLNFIERLEKYVVDVQEWGLSLEENLDEYDNQKLKVKIGKLIEDLTGSEDITDFKYAENFFDIIKDSQKKSSLAIIENLKKIAKNTGDASLIQETKIVEDKLNQFRRAKEEAENETRETMVDLNEVKSENLFLKSIKTQDFEDVLNLMHHIGISSSTIQNFIKGIVYRIDEGIDFTGIELKDILLKINMEVQRINSISRFATKANFKVGTKPTKIDLQEFIGEYLNNIVRPFLPSVIELTVLIESAKPFIMEFKPLEITILIDNLINNSKKAKAKRIFITLNSVGSDSLIMHFKDNGIGISEDIQTKIFEYGFTTTDGSGLGLTHAKSILENIGSTIELNNDFKKGTEFIINFNRF